MWAVENFDEYVSVPKLFKVTTDHIALCGLFKIKKSAGRPARWVLRLQPNQTEVSYRRGTLNSIADHLSRFPLDGGNAPLNLMLGDALIPLLTIDVVSAQKSDPFYSWLMRILKGPSDNPDYRTRIPTYVIKNSILCRSVSGWARIIFVSDPSKYS